jgi:WD40 repeat protein
MKAGANRVVAMLGLGGLVVGAAVAVRPFLVPELPGSRGNVEQVFPAQFKTPEPEAVFRVAAADKDLCKFPGAAGAGKYSSAPRLGANADWGAPGPEARQLFALPSHQGVVNAVMFSDDGRFAISAGADGIVRVSSAVNGRALGQIVFPKAGPITVVAYDTQSGRLAVGFESGQAAVVDLEREEPLFQLSGHKGAIRSLTFGIHQLLLLSAAEDGAVVQWYLEGKTARAVKYPKGGPALLVAKDEQKNDQQIPQIVYSHDGQLIWTPTPDTNLADPKGSDSHLAAMTDLHMLYLLPSLNRSPGPTDASRRTGGIAAGRQGLICAFDDKSGWPIWRTQGTLAPIWDMIVINGEKFLATYGGDKAFEVFSLDDRSCVARTSGDTAGVTAAAMARVAPAALSGYRDGSVRLFLTPAFKINARDTAANLDPEEIFYLYIYNLITKKNYAELEFMADNLRENLICSRQGHSQLQAFYEVVAYPRKENDENWLERLEFLNAWLEERPESLTCQVALARAHIGHAWHARGGGFANTVGEKAQQLFAERLLRAGKLLVEIDGRDDAHDPMTACLQLMVAKGLGMDKEQVKRLVRKAADRDPEFFPTYQPAIEYLLPRWHGEAGEVGELAAELADKLGGTAGDALYARLACLVFDYEGSAVYQVGKFDSQRIKNGGRTLVEEFPEAKDFAKKLRGLALLSGDNETARQLALRAQSADERRQRTFGFSEQIGLDGKANYHPPKILRRFSLHSKHVRSLFVTADQRRIVSVGSDGLILVSDAESGEIVSQQPKPKVPLRSVAFDPIGGQLAWASDARDARLLRWNLKPDSPPTEHRTATDMRQLAFSPDGSMLAAATEQGNASLWDVARPARGQTLVHFAAVRAVAFSADGRRVATGGCEQVVKLWNVASGKLEDVLSGHDGCICAIALSPDGQTLAAACDGGSVTIWDLPSRTRVAVFYKRLESFGLAFTPDGSTLLVKDERSIALVDLKTKTGRSFGEHTKPPTTFRLAGDGRHLFVGNTAGEVCVWDLLDPPDDPESSKPPKS